MRNIITFILFQVVLRALRPSTKGVNGTDCMANVVDVWVSGDLQVAKVQISLYNANGDDLSSRFEELQQLTGWALSLSKYNPVSDRADDELCNHAAFCWQWRGTHNQIKHDNLAINSSLQLCVPLPL